MDEESMTNWIFLLASLMVPLLLFSDPVITPSDDSPTVMLAILARNKAHTLPTYLECIDNLDYDKKKISVYINTNNNSDNTEEILRAWAKAHEKDYASIEFETHTIDDLGTDQPHEWTAKRFQTLALIRNKSMQKAIEKKSDLYFVVDCDNFIVPNTLSHLVAKNKPIVAPLLKSIPELEDIYSNYFCAVSDTGYYADHPDYIQFWSGTKKGTFEVPVVHCTYLIQREAIPYLNYTDGSDDYEFIIFSRIARKNNVPQYICNEQNFGTLLHFKTNPTLCEEQERVAAMVASNRDFLDPTPRCEDVFSYIYKNKIWGENNKGEGFSGPGSSIEETAPYREFLQRFLAEQQIKSVVDVGCGDWTFSHTIDWSGIDYKGFDVVEDVIKKNIQTYGSPNIHFEMKNGAEEGALPKADLLICKEVLQHLPYDDIHNFLKNLDGYKYCLITNDVNPFSSTTTNHDIVRGSYRCLDLQATPFNVEAEVVLTYPARPFLKQVLLIKPPIKKKQI